MKYGERREGELERPDILSIERLCRGHERGYASMSLHWAGRPGAALRGGSIGSIGRLEPIP